MSRNISITTDLASIDQEATIRLLNGTHFAAHRERESILKSLENSVCFAAFIDGKQVGFGRVITDHATTAYLCDMVVDDSLRGQGVGSILLKAILAHPPLADLKWILRTRDAASLYAKFDFIDPVLPGRFMERTKDNKGWDHT